MIKGVFPPTILSLSHYVASFQRMIHQCVSTHSHFHCWSDFRNKAVEDVNQFYLFQLRTDAVKVFPAMNFNADVASEAVSLATGSIHSAYKKKGFLLRTTTICTWTHFNHILRVIWRYGSHNDSQQCFREY